MNKKIVIRTATVAVSLNVLLKGQLSYLNNFYDIRAVSGYDEHLKEVAKREKVKTQDIRIKRNISPLRDLVSLYKLIFLFRKQKPLLVHSITPKAGLLSMIAAKIAGVPIRIHTFTGLIFPSKKGLLRTILIKMDQLLCVCATHIYPEGLGVANDLISYKITKKPLKVLANGNVNGIDVAYFNPDLIADEERQQLKKELGIGPDDFVFVFVGRLVGDKGINELIEAFQKLSSETNAIKLVLVGPLESDLDPLRSKTLADIKSNKSIVAVGFQKDVRPYFGISEALVFPSYREGFPNVVLQAGAMGLACIVTNINGCNEIIIEGQNGTIIPIKATEALYAAMKNMIEKPEYRVQLQKKSREMICSRYEQKLVWEAILAEYKKLEKNV